MVESRALDVELLLSDISQQILTTTEPLVQLSDDCANLLYKAWVDHPVEFKAIAGEYSLEVISVNDTEQTDTVMIVVLSGFSTQGKRVQSVIYSNSEIFKEMGEAFKNVNKWWFKPYMFFQNLLSRIRS